MRQLLIERGEEFEELFDFSKLLMREDSEEDGEVKSSTVTGTSTQIGGEGDV